MTFNPTQAPVAQPAPAPVKQGNGLAVAGFVLGLLGLLGSFIPVLNIGGIVLGIIGVILAATGLPKARRTGSGRGLALSGIVLGGLAMVIGIAVNVMFVNAVDGAVEEVTGTTVSTPADDAAEDSGAADDAADDAADAAADGATDDAPEAPLAAAGTTRDNPAPLSSEITGKDWTVAVNSVTTVEKDSFGQTAAEGMVLLSVNLIATYHGDDPQGDSAWVGIEFVTADGNSIDSFDGSTLFIPEDQFDTLETVFTGASVTGDKILEVPADWTSGTLSVTPELFRDAVFVAVQ